MIWEIVGVLLILIALVLGGLQHFVYTSSNALYGSEGNKWYFYGLVGLIGLVGIVLLVWALMMKETPQKATQ